MGECRDKAKGRGEGYKVYRVKANSSKERGGLNEYYRSPNKGCSLYTRSSTKEGPNEICTSISNRLIENGQVYDSHNISSVL